MLTSRIFALSTLTIYVKDARNMYSPHAGKFHQLCTSCGIGMSENAVVCAGPTADARSAGKSMFETKGNDSRPARDRVAMSRPEGDETHPASPRVRVAFV